MKTTIYEKGNYRILEVSDECSTLDDLMGDCFDSSVNPEIPPEDLTKQKKSFIKEVNTAGVYGYVLEKKCEACGNWEHVDSCYGFVGSYEEGHERYGHYIVDEMKGQIK